MQLYPPHDKNFGPTPTRTVEEITDELCRILAAGVRGSDDQRHRASALIRSFANETPVWAPDDAHTLVGLLSECFRTLQSAQSPFESYLEAPESILAFYRTHGRNTRAAADELIAQTRLLMRDVAEHLIGATTWTTLVKLGLGGTADV